MSIDWLTWRRKRPSVSLPLPTGSTPPGGAHKPRLKRPTPEMPTPMILDSMNAVIEVLKEERDADRKRAEELRDLLTKEQDENAHLRYEVKCLREAYDELGKATV